MCDTLMVEGDATWLAPPTDDVDVAGMNIVRVDHEVDAVLVARGPDACRIESVVIIPPDEKLGNVQLKRGTLAFMNSRHRILAAVAPHVERAHINTRDLWACIAPQIRDTIASGPPWKVQGDSITTTQRFIVTQYVVVPHADMNIASFEVVPFTHKPVTATVYNQFTDEWRNLV